MEWNKEGREANAERKGQMAVKLIREIMVVANLSGPDPENNSRLAAVVERARQASVYGKTIERAIAKGTSLVEENVRYELVTFEGFAPHNVPVIVECHTDDRQRTQAEIQALFQTGTLQQPGSMAAFFQRVGIIEAVHEGADHDAGRDAADADAQAFETMDAGDFSAGETGARFLADPNQLDAVSRALKAAGWKILIAETCHMPVTLAELEPAARQEVADFLDQLGGHDDVHRLYAAMK